MSLDRHEKLKRGLFTLQCTRLALSTGQAEELVLMAIGIEIFQDHTLALTSEMTAVNGVDVPLA